MKGVYINNQLEYRAEIIGDELHQGDEVNCSISIKNHGTQPQKIDAVNLELALGDQKKIKEKAADAFEKISSASGLFGGEIQAGEKKSAEWKFTLDKNAVVTDKGEGLYLIYGDCTSNTGVNQLALNVQPHAHIKFFVGALESPFQFELKGYKHADGWVQAKFKPPGVKRFSMLNELLLLCRFEEEALALKYKFKVKKFETTDAATVGISKGVSEVEQRIEQKKYLLSGGFFDHDYVEKQLNEALETVATGF